MGIIGMGKRNQKEMQEDSEGQVLCLKDSLRASSNQVTSAFCTLITSGFIVLKSKTA